MKFLGWMHRKFQHNGGDPFKDLTAGNPCNYLSGRSSLDDRQQQQYHNPRQSKLPARQMPGRWSCSDDRNDPPVPIEDDDQLFDGLLAIGTLGSSPGAGENPHGTATPTFGLSLEAVPCMDTIAEKEEHTEATELDLMVINSELEKALVVPEGDRLSSARASHVSAKQLVVPSCPLREYLLGSSVEMAETTEQQQPLQRKEEMDRHHQRTSLAELFMKSNLTEEGGGRKEKTVAGVPLMVKNMLKGRGSRRLPSFAAFSGGGDDFDDHAGGSENKFQKIMQIFHKKIHPENPVAAKKAEKRAAKGMTSNKRRGGGGGGGAGTTGSPVSAASAAIRGGRWLRGGESSTVASHSNQCRFASPGTDSVVTGSSESNGNREQWIRTDADYLVLEF